MGKVFAQPPFQNEKASSDGSNSVTICKMFDAERKKLTDKFYAANIL